MLGVVLSHSMADTLSKNIFTWQWHVSNFFLGLVSPAVGVFYLISGALILSSPHTDDIKYLWKHRLVKIIVPFVIWSAITSYVLMNVDNNFSWGTWFNRLLLIYHQFPILPFWFLYPLIGFYLISPMVKAFVDHVSMKVLDYIIAVWFVTNIVLPFIVEALPHQYGIYFSYIPQSNMIFIGKAFGYFLLGYRLSKQPIKEHSFGVNLAATILLFAIVMVVNFEDSLLHLHIPAIGFDSIFSVMLACELFLTVRIWAEKHQINRVRRHYITDLSILTYGVYLTHGLVIQVVEEVFKIVDPALVFLITITVCLLFGYLISKIPKVRFFLLGMD